MQADTVRETSTTNREQDWLWLCSVPGLYWKEKMALLRYFGGPGEIRRAGRDGLKLWEELGIDWVRKLYPCMEDGFLETVTEQMERSGVFFVSREHPAFPTLLREISDCPYGLFYKGRLPQAGEERSLGIVGARACSAYGRRMAERIAQQAARRGIPVISGLAMGIDGLAGRAALLAGGESYAVLGCGADICYPKINRDLYERLAEMGGILSEFPCGTPPQRIHFPMRNRIISGLSRWVAVVEAGDHSGSLITARCALDQGREVYAVPGRVGDPLSEGCNALISDGAGVVRSPEDFVQELDESVLPVTIPVPKPALKPTFMQTLKSAVGPAARSFALPTAEQAPGSAFQAVLKSASRSVPKPVRSRPDSPNPSSKSSLQRGKAPAHSGLAPDDELVYSSLDLSPKSRERIAEEAGLTLERAQVSLVALQLADLAQEVAKNQFIRN